MTTMRETAINKPLSGLELREILRRDFDRLLANEGALSSHIAYGRCAFQIVLRLHTANPLAPIAESETASRPPSDQELLANEALAAVERAPLTDAENDSVGGTTLQRTVTSPNAERVREGLPVPIEVRQQDGTKTVEKIVYPKPKDLGEGDVVVADSTNEAKAAWRR